MAGYTGTPPIITKGITFALDASNNESYREGETKWNDLSRNSYVSNINNGVTYIKENVGFFSFDGSDDYINTGYDLSWNDTNDVSIGFWVKPSDLTTHTPFIGKRSYEWQFIQFTTRLTFVHWNNVGYHNNGPVININDVFTDLGWINIHMTWSSSNNELNFYRNGINIGTYEWYDASINKNTNNSVNLGGDIYKWSTKGSYWNGSLSSVFFYDRALSEQEIIKNYNSLKHRFRN